MSKSLCPGPVPTLSSAMWLWSCVPVEPAWACPILAFVCPVDLCVCVVPPPSISAISAFTGAQEAPPWLPWFPHSCSLKSNYDIFQAELQALAILPVGRGKGGQRSAPCCCPGASQVLGRSSGSCAMGPARATCATHCFLSMGSRGIGRGHVLTKDTKHWHKMNRIYALTEAWNPGLSSACPFEGRQEESSCFPAARASGPPWCRLARGCICPVSAPGVTWPSSELPVLTKSRPVFTESGSSKSAFIGTGS